MRGKTRNQRTEYRREFIVDGLLFIDGEKNKRIENRREFIVDGLLFIDGEKNKRTEKSGFCPLVSGYSRAERGNTCH